jgi:hypothetical protein
MMCLTRIILVIVLLSTAALSQALTQSGTPANKDSKTETAEKKTQPLAEDPGFASKKTPVQIAHFTAAPLIDGVLNDEVWKSAPVFGNFLQVQPGDNTAPTNPTEFMMAYDAKTLYLAFRVKQPRDTVRATVARRDNIFNDDYVLLYLDTFNDQRQAYVVSFNPFGIQADGTFTEGRGEDYSVDLVMESKGVLTEDGYTIEAAIPFKSLRYEAGKNKQWGTPYFPSREVHERRAQFVDALTIAASTDRSIKRAT